MRLQAGAGRLPSGLRGVVAGRCVVAGQCGEKGEGRKRCWDASGPAWAGEKKNRTGLIPRLGQKKKSNLVFKIKTFPFLVFKSQANFQTNSSIDSNILSYSIKNGKFC